MNAPQSVAAYMAANRKQFDNARAVLSFPYHSAVRLKTTRTGAGPFTYTASVATVKAFNYKIGDVLDGAGFPAGTIATPADTNLLSASETRDGATVLVWGISIGIRKGEPRLVREFFRVTDVSLSLSGTDNYALGRLEFFPQVGGPFGQQRTKLEAGNLAETVGPLEGFITNGNPTANSFFKLPDPLVWQAKGAGKDTSLVMSFTPREAFTLSSADRAAVAGAAPGASGRVEAFSAPADGADGTFVELVVRLHSVSISALSPNG